MNIDRLNDIMEYPVEDTVIIAVPERIRRRRYFKREARHIIFSGSNWYKLVFASMFMLVIMVSVNYICGSFLDVFNVDKNIEAYLTDIIYLAVIVPFIYGFCLYNIKLADNESPRFGVIFDVYGSMSLLARTYKVFFTYIWRYFIWFAIIYGALIAAEYYFIPAVIAAVALIICGAIFLQRYYLTLYVALRNDDITVREAVKCGTSRMKGYKFDTLMFQFTFTAWFIVSFFTLGITAVLYVIPYYVLANLEFAEFIFNTNSQTQRRLQ